MYHIVLTISKVCILIKKLAGKYSSVYLWIISIFIWMKILGIPMKLLILFNLFSQIS